MCFRSSQHAPNSRPGANGTLGLGQTSAARDFPFEDEWKPPVPSGISGTSEPGPKTAYNRWEGKDHAPPLQNSVRRLHSMPGGAQRWVPRVHDPGAAVQRADSSDFTPPHDMARDSLRRQTDQMGTDGLTMSRHEEQQYPRQPQQQQRLEGLPGDESEGEGDNERAEDSEPAVGKIEGAGFGTWPVQQPPDDQARFGKTAEYLSDTGHGAPVDEQARFGRSTAEYFSAAGHGEVSDHHQPSPTSRPHPPPSPSPPPADQSNVRVRAATASHTGGEEDVPHSSDTEGAREGGDGCAPGAGIGENLSQGGPDRDREDAASHHSYAGPAGSHAMPVDSDGDEYGDDEVGGDRAMEGHGGATAVPQSGQTPARAHRCAECGQSFAHASTLSAHKVTHKNDARPYVCAHPGCGKSFGRSYTLQMHKVCSS